MAVFCTTSGETGILKYALTRYIVEKTFLLANLNEKSNKFGSGYLSDTVRAFNLR